MDGLGELLDAFEARVVQRLALEDAEPYLDLVEPTRAGGREMKGDDRVRSQPVVVVLVGAQVVQDDVDLPVGGLLGDDVILKCPGPRAAIPSCRWRSVYRR